MTKIFPVLLAGGEGLDYGQCQEVHFLNNSQVFQET